MTITVNAVTAKTVVNPWTGDHELLAAGVAHRGREGDVVKDGFVRDPSDPRGELRVVNQLYRWVYRHPAEVLLTHGSLEPLERRVEEAELRAGVRGIKHKIHVIRDVHVHLDVTERRQPQRRHPERQRATWRKSQEPLVQELGEQYLQTGEERIASLLYGVAASDAGKLLDHTDTVLPRKKSEGRREKRTTRP